MKTKLTLFDKIQLAVTFAEENVPEAVMEVGTRCKTSGPCLTILGKPRERETLTRGGVGNGAKA